MRNQSGAGLTFLTSRIYSLRYGGNNSMGNDRPCVCCPSCGLNQFFNSEKPTCRRCHKGLCAEEKVQEPIPEEPAAPLKDKAHWVGDRIKCWRRARGMSQRDLVRVTGLARPLVSRCENGHTLSTVQSLETMAGGLGVTVYEILTVPKTQIGLMADPFIREILPYLPRLDSSRRQGILRAAQKLGVKSSVRCPA